MTRWDGYGLVVVDTDYSIRLLVRGEGQFDYNRAVRLDTGHFGEPSIWFEEGKVGMRLV